MSEESRHIPKEVSSPAEKDVLNKVDQEKLAQLVKTLRPPKIISRRTTEQPHNRTLQHEAVSAELVEHVTTLPTNPEPSALVEKQLPNKSLAECRVEDLDGLTEEQLHEVLFQASIYRNRSFNQTTDVARYRIQVEPSNDATTDFALRELKYSQPTISVDDVIKSKDPNEFDTIPMKLPFIEDGDSSYIDFTLLPVINKQLAEKGLPKLHALDKSTLKRFWSKNPYAALDQHSYGDGRLVSRDETLQGMLSKEIRDLKALGFDFDDITDAIQPVLTALHTSLNREKPKDTEFAFQLERILRGPIVEFPNQPNRPSEYRSEKDEKLLPTIYEHTCQSDPDITAETIQWKYNVIDVPFPNFKPSVLEHRLQHPSNKGWTIPLSEASLSLYENRIVEGYASPHYRISGPRTVWALQLGSPEVQAKAFALDWENVTDELLAAENGKRIVQVNIVMNYILEFFPQDVSYWKEHGFSGYNFDGQSYDSLQFLARRLKERLKESVREPSDQDLGIANAINYPRMKNFED